MKDTCALADDGDIRKEENFPQDRTHEANEDRRGERGMRVRGPRGREEGR